MQFTLCKLKPRGPLHLGEREGLLEGSSTIIHSDTLFSAFCHAFQLLYGDTQLINLIQKLENKEPYFLISSMFPYWGKSLYFRIPKNQYQMSVTKKMKVEFIEKTGLEQLLHGEKLDKVIDARVTIPRKEDQYVPWDLENIPRVGLSRLDNSTGERFFHFGQVRYHEDAGFFFLVKYLNRAFQNKFEATIRLLADEGFGGDRSSGKGMMETPIFEPLEIDTPVQGNGVMTLSLYYSGETETDGIKDGFYDLIERKGYIYSPYGSNLRRRSVRMFTEGSVFPTKLTRVGQLVDVTPEIFQKHKVFRYGYIFALPCHLE